MKFELFLISEAEQDAAEACAYYENEQAGLGDRFHDELARVLLLIEENPRLYPLSGETVYRKAVMKVFPFASIIAWRSSAWSLLRFTIHGAIRSDGGAGRVKLFVVNLDKAVCKLAQRARMQ